MRRRTVPLVFLLIAGSFGPAEALDKFSVIHSSVSGSQAVLFVTKDAKIFEKHGLDVSITFAAGGPTAISALLSGDVQAALMAGPAAVSANLSGADVTVIMGLIPTMEHFLFAQKEIRKPEDLRGKKIAVSRFNSADDFAVRFALRKWGLTPDKDVVLLQIGEQPARLTALRGGTIDATLIQPPLTMVARKAGFTELAGLGDMGIDYLGTCVTTTKSLIKNREDLVRRFVRAFVEGIHFYKTHKEASLASITKFMKLTDSEAAEESYRTYALKFTPRVPYPTVKGVQTILDDLGTKDPRAKAANPNDFVEPKFLRELEESGVIKSLYGS